MAYKKEYYERLSLFRDSIQMKKPERVPMLSDFYTWKMLDSDYHYKLSEVCTDYAKAEQVMREFHERYQFDAYVDLNTRNVITPMNTLGGSNYTFDDEKGTINYTDNPKMEGDEYEELVADTPAFIWKIFVRHYPGLTKGKVVQAVREFQEFMEYAVHIGQVFSEEYGCPVIADPAIPSIVESFGMFYGCYRGIKNISIDMRKHKKELVKACQYLYQTMVKPQVDAVVAQTEHDCITDELSGWLAHTILSRKQFEEFFWPEWKTILDRIVDAGKTIYIYVEGSMMPFTDYLKDYPKGHIIIHPEQDDIFELRKKLPNVCLCGGMKTELLGTGTPQECVDYAKRLIEEMGEGYIFSQNKMVSFRNDCTRENLLAVNNFVREYKL